MCTHRAHGHFRCELARVAVEAAGDRGKRDRPGTELARHLERPAVAGREQLRLALVSSAPHGPDGVHDVPRGQLPGRRRLGVAGLAAAEQPALREDRRAAGPVDRTVHPAAAEQRRVRRVDDHVDRLFGDVAADGFDPSHDGETLPIRRCGCSAEGTVWRYGPARRSARSAERRAGARLRRAGGGADRVRLRLCASGRRSGRRG